MSGAYIYNNTIYVSPQSVNPSESAVYFKNWNTGINNIFFYNNIFYTAGTVPLVNIPAGYSATFNGNIYWSSGNPFSVFYGGTHYTTLDSWRAATGNEKLSGSNTGFYSDPLLTNVGAGGTVGYGNSLTSLNAYKVNSPSSPANSAALDLNSFSIDPGTMDFWGSLLPGATLMNIGGNQHSVALPVVLLGFHGNCAGSSEQISWSTAEESNMKSIELLYSADGRRLRNDYRDQAGGK